MTIYSYAEHLPKLGAARAAATGRAWFLVEDTKSGRVRLTDDPLPPSKQRITSVFSPVDPDDGPSAA
jgi:hypothetical protein